MADGARQYMSGFTETWPMAGGLHQRIHRLNFQKVLGKFSMRVLISPWLSMLSLLAVGLGTLKAHVCEA